MDGMNRSLGRIELRKSMKLAAPSGQNASPGQIELRYVLIMILFFLRQRGGGTWCQSLCPALSGCLFFYSKNNDIKIQSPAIRKGLCHSLND